MFTKNTIEKLNYYVYMLVDPRDNSIFYVGKGKGNRVFQHASGILEDNIKENDLKTKQISEIINNGKDVISYIVRHNLDEKEALMIESVLIDMIPYLTNKVKGHYSGQFGLMTTSEIELMYQAEDVEVEENAIMINVNKLYQPTLTENELYEITRKWWKINKNRSPEIKYALCIYNGIIREVYRVKSWEKDSENDRLAFKGEKAYGYARDKYLRKSVRKYQKKGNQNPIRYGDKKISIINIFNYYRIIISKHIDQKQLENPILIKIIYEGFVPDLYSINFIDYKYSETLKKFGYDSLEDEKWFEKAINILDINLLKAMLTWELRKDYWGGTNTLINDGIAKGRVIRILELIIKNNLI